MNTFLHIIYRIVLLSCFLCFWTILKAGNGVGISIRLDTVPKNQSDTIPTTQPPKKRSSITRYLNIITDQQQRDSLFLKLSKTNAPVPMSDSMIFKSRENSFNVYGGKQIRYIYYNQLRYLEQRLKTRPLYPTNSSGLQIRCIMTQEYG